MTAPEPEFTGTQSGAVPLYGRRFVEDTDELYREMRRDHGPVVPVLLEGGEPAWLVIGYREAHRVLTDSQLFARDPYRCHGPEYVPPQNLGYLPGILMFLDGPVHARRAGAVSAALAEVDQFELRADCERFSDRLIDVFATAGEADLIEQYAYHMPVLVMGSLLGLPDSELVAFADDMKKMNDGREEAIEAFGRYVVRMTSLLASKREWPGADVTSHMIANATDVTDEELIQDLLVVLSGGQENTAHWIGNTLRLMLTDDRFSLTLSGGRRSVGQALNEVMWEASPVKTAPARWAVRETQLGGRTIRAGDVVVVGPAGANTDPRIRPDAHGDAAGNHAHLGFGTGEHGCPHPAPELAQVMAQTAVEVLLDRLPDVRLAVPEHELEWRPAFHIRGLSALPVRFRPTHVVGG
ncbi:cytochrome P450 [Actinoallomurus rhizosphaericola]|uniref:cytochrome P450 n=1 Tax=Actinoallomurus rhizosphaericola TaxID=2952536 RepID=UPI0020924A35|nr:cytochrome P450 [Actinoallomurus rhizosphaericola]MCO5997251.1 cytochrome P450 [Actinoallomurus rhizosphaericola]